MASYHAQREEALKKRAEAAKDLQIGTGKRALEEEAASQKAKRRRAKSSSARSTTPVEPTRRSKRVQGLTAEGLKIEDAPKLAPAASGPSHDWSRKEGVLGLTDLTFGEGGEKSSGALFAALSSEEAVFEVEGTGDEWFRELDIRYDEHVARVVPERIYSAVFCPRRDVVVAFLGDKWGRVGAFRPGAEEGEQVTVLEPHKRAVSGMLIPESTPDCIFTCSYDQSCRVTHAGGGGRSEEALVWDALLTGLALSEDGNIVWASTNAGEVVRSDRREKGGEIGYDVGERKVGALALRDNGYEMVTAGYEGVVRLWDVRKWKTDKKKSKGNYTVKPDKELTHTLGKGVTHVEFNKTTSSFVTTGNDDRLRVFRWEEIVKPQKSSSSSSSKGLETCAVRHDTHTGRWVSNFKTIFDPHSGEQGDQVIACGAKGSRSLDFFDVASGGRLFSAQNDERLTAIPAINAIHPMRPIAVSGTASGRAYIWTTRDDEEL